MSNAAGPALRHCPSGWALERPSLPGLALERPGLPGLALKNDEDDSGEKQRPRFHLYFIESYPMGTG